MKTKVVYVAVSSHNDFFLEELWASLYSLRQFTPPACEVVVLSDAETAERIKCRPALYEMINELNVSEQMNGVADTKIVVNILVILMHQLHKVVGIRLVVLLQV